MMKRYFPRLAAAALCLVLAACAAPPAEPEAVADAAEIVSVAPEVTGESALDAALKDTAEYLLAKVPQPQPGSIGGEWLVLGMSRSGSDVPDGYFEGFRDAAEEYVRERGGVLSERKNTEYSRMILALTAIGSDPADVGGYDLLLPLADFEQTVWQGINGPIWALIALDSGDYDIPPAPGAAVQADRDMYLDYILDEQLGDGGWALIGDAADADLTAMALQALSDYSGRAQVKEAIDRALDCLSAMQNENGSFSSWGEENAESCAQAVTALSCLGIAPDDGRFVKNGVGALDALLSFRAEDGGFRHTRDGGSDMMATEQAFYALAAARRAASGQTALYDMK